MFLAYLHFCNRNECAIIFFFPIDIKTTARRDGDDLIINGSKMWITNGAQADYMCLLANTNQGPAHKSKSLIVLPMNLPGIAIDCLNISYCICVDPFLFSDLFAPWKQYKGCFNYKINHGDLAYGLLKDQSDKLITFVYKSHAIGVQNML